jgi:hypothetical protein
MFQFSKLDVLVFLAKPDVLIFQTGCLVLADRTYVSLVLIIVILLSYASPIICSHTLLLHPMDPYIELELSWFFLKNM